MYNYFSSGSLYGRNYRTRTFTEIYPDLDTFDTECAASPLNVLNPENMEKLYYLLYAHYGNSHIASSDETQFKFKLMSIVFTDGAVWQSKLEIQDRLRSADQELILAGPEYLSQSAQNPGYQTSSPDAMLNHIDSQSKSGHKRNIITGNVELYESIKNCTSSFINLFRKLFLTIAAPEAPLWYEFKD